MYNRMIVTLQMDEDDGCPPAKEGGVDDTDEGGVSAQNIDVLIVIVMSQKEAKVSLPPSKDRDLDECEPETDVDEVVLSQLMACKLYNGNFILSGRGHRSSRGQWENQQWRGGKIAQQRTSQHCPCTFHF